MLNPFGRYTPLKTNMSLEHRPFRKRTYIFIPGGFSNVMVVFEGVTLPKSWILDAF